MFQLQEIRACGTSDTNTQLPKHNCLFLLHFCYPSLIRRPRSLCSLCYFALKLTSGN